LNNRPNRLGIYASATYLFIVALIYVLTAYTGKTDDTGLEWIPFFMLGMPWVKVDARLLLLSGFLISAFALWQMMNYTIVLSASDIVWPGVIQGFGLGLVFVPLSALTFSTLTPALRADGTATYSLMRNIGSSIGISIVQTLMTRGTQVAHADLAANVNIFNPLMQPMLESGSRYDIAVMNASITQQASMIAYLNDFKLMFVATLLVVPLLLLIRPMRSVSSETLAHAAAD